jgi:capsular polysaccharide biosynthesis protein
VGPVIGRLPSAPPGSAPAPAPAPGNRNGDRPQQSGPGRSRPHRLRASLVVIAALAAVGAAAGAAFALAASGDYQSHAYVLVSPPPTLADNGSAVGLAHAYARVALEEGVVGEALTARGLSTAADYPGRSLSVSTSPDAPLIEIVGRAPTAGAATALADTASRAFVGYLRQVGRNTGYQLTLLSPATAAEAPGSPGMALSVTVGAAAGGVLGAGWRLLRA